MVAVKRNAPPPLAKHLDHWERVCRFIEAQPYRSVTVPFPSDPPMTVRLLKRMGHFNLIKHRDDCTWRVAKDWQTRLTRLRLNLPDEAKPPAEDMDTTPFVVDCGIDTLYVNLLADDLPLGLLHACEELKAEAQARDDTVVTPWRVWDAPLSMWKSGKGSSGKGKGVSWGHIARNEFVEIRFRKTAVSGIIGRIHFLARGLWTYGPLDDLNAVAALINEMWYWNYQPSEGEDPLQPPGCQTSEIHLCADVAHFHLDPVDLERIVTRSIHQVAHVPNEADDQAIGTDEDDSDFYDEAMLDDLLPFDIADLDAWSEEDDEEPDEDDEPGDDEEPDDEDLAEDEGARVDLWAKRVSGFTFSPGGDLMVVIYNKTLQERAKWDMEWMKEVHRAGGWDGKVQLMRTEARFKRPAFRTFVQAFGDDNRAWLDDPWQLVTRTQDLWAYTVGMPPEADIPDVTYKGWMRLAQPTGGENRGRWPTDPLWQVVQRAKFTDMPAVPLKRMKELKPDLLRLDAELFGLFKTRSVLMGSQLDDKLSFTKEVLMFLEHMKARDENPLATFKPKDFPMDVREKARMMGKAIPILLPFKASD